MSLLGFLSGRADATARIDGDRARSLVSDGATLLDVRTAAEFRLGHIDGATNLPIGEIDRAKTIIGTSEPVIVYCRSGARSARATIQMRSLGYTAVFDLGGLDNW